MAEMTNQSVSRPVNRPANPFGGGIQMALVAILVTLMGFWPTFFSRLGSIDAAHLLHGTLSTGWLVLVLVQASLIRFRKFKWHRTIGWISLLWFALLVATSCYMLTLMLSGTGPTPIPFGMAKIFAFSDVTALPLMIIAYAGAITLRKDRHVHSRLMSVTLLAGLMPAIARAFLYIFIAAGIAAATSMNDVLKALTLAMHPTFIFVLVVLATAILFDYKKDRLRWPFPFAFVWFAINYATFFPGLSSQWFDHVAKAIAAMA